MKFARLAGLALVSGVAVVFATAAAASANPLFNPTSGTFTVSGGAGTLKAPTANDTVACTSSEAAGKIASALLAGPFLLTFRGCKSKSGSTSTECAVHSEGESAEVILTGTVHAVLVLALLNGSRWPGLWILPVGTSKFATLVENTCTIETEVKGSSVGLISPIGVSQTTGKLVFDPYQNITLDLHNGESVRVTGLTAFGTNATEETSASVTFGQATEVT